MIKHIVMWTLKERADGFSKEEIAVKIQRELNALKEKISAIYHIETGLNFNQTEAAFDIALYSEFKTKEDLATYQKHPDHVKVAEFINNVRLERAVVDFETV